MKVGIVGGSFDPVHYGHLIMSEHLRTIKNLDKVIFIPTGQAPHKIYINSGNIRLKMVEMAIKDNIFFDSCDIEINKDSTTYTIDTMNELKLKYPKCEFYFIIGLDNLFNLEEWNNIGELGKLTKFLVSHRIFNETLTNTDIRDKCNMLKEKYNLDIEIVDTPIIEISSSEIRSRVFKNESIRYLTPEKVVKFIEQNRLYK